MAEHPLKALIDTPQWCLWRIELNKNNDEIKVPCFNGKRINITNPKNYRTFAAVQNQRKEGEGLAFIFTKSDPFFFLDVDNCREGDKWSLLSQELCAMLSGAAMEVSMSGNGLHIIGKCNKAVAPPRKKSPVIRAELYMHDRFIAIADMNKFQGDASIDHTAAIARIGDMYFQKNNVALKPTGWTTEPCDGWRGYESDTELIAHALKARSKASIFGGSVSFADLWNANSNVLGQKWPCPKGHRDYDYSSADSALAQHLAFWTGNNCERIKILMYQSALARDKWDTHRGYLERTIEGSTARQDKFHVIPEKVNSPQIGYSYLSIQGQMEYFKGCVYIESLHRVFTPNGSLLKPEVFKAVYGGHIFALDAMDQKTTKNAFEAFTESQGWRTPKVNRTTFRPDLESGKIMTLQNGRTAVNVWYPRFGKRCEGDVSLFLNHVSKLLPSPYDQEILLSYMSACLQYPGIKFQWCPCIQGEQGNGKSFFYKCLEYALGDEYCHLLDPNDLKDTRFNAWVENRLLVGVEEIRMAGKYEIADRLKPLITNDRVPIQGKGRDQVTGDNCANFILFSNYRDAVLKTSGDRRYAVFYTAQQDIFDIEKDGLDANYFDILFQWARDGGFAIIADYLSKRAIRHNMMGRAPHTTSTDAARVESLGPLEQNLLEAQSIGEMGLTAECIEFAAADRIARRSGRPVHPRTIVHALQNIGYLPIRIGGDKENRIWFAGKKWRLYVRRDLINTELTIDVLSAVCRTPFS